MKYYAFLDDDRDYLLVHASPRKPISEYLFKEDVQKPSKLSHAFAAMPGSFAFVGHTHMPGIFTAVLDEGGGVSVESLYDYDYGNEIEGPYALDTNGGKLRFIVNPGSVGQPRDRDPRAGYAILDATGDVPTIEFFRLEYPIQVTCDKIHGHPELADRLGDRLLVGE
jgi:diadenosine tetraphosphatase ApaH/serine/threonine PP2A family protein phosphatase